MTAPELSDTAKRFIFAYIDSAELLDVLLLMSDDSSRTWEADELAQELRTNPNSINGRLRRLQEIGLITASAPDMKRFHYHPKTPDLDLIVQELKRLNPTIRHKILQLIFSPLKQGRVIADGFRITSSKPGKGESDG